MRLNFTFGNAVAVLPLALAEHIEKATKRDIRILLELAAEPRSFFDLSAATVAVATKLGISEADVRGALAFWRGTGVLDTDEQSEAPCARACPAPVVLSDKGLPHYNTEELSAVLTRRKGLTQLINDAQQAFGKVFNTSEISIIVGVEEHDFDKALKAIYNEFIK